MREKIPAPKEQKKTVHTVGGKGRLRTCVLLTKGERKLRRHTQKGKKVHLMV